MPARTVPQGITRRSRPTTRPRRDVDALVKAMTEHMNDVDRRGHAGGRLGRVIDGASRVRGGEHIGLDNGKLVSCGDSSVTDVSLDLLGQMNAADGVHHHLFWRLCSRKQRTRFC